MDKWNGGLFRAIYLNSLPSPELYLQQAGQPSFHVLDGCRFGPEGVKCFCLQQRKQNVKQCL